MKIISAIVKTGFYAFVIQFAVQPQDITWLIGLIIQIVTLLAAFATVVTLVNNIKNKVGEHDLRFNQIDKKLEQIDRDIKDFGRMDERLKSVERRQK